MNDACYNESDSDAAAKIANAFEWPRQPPKLSLLLGLRHPAGGGPSHGDRQEARKLVKIARAVREI